MVDPERLRRLLNYASDRVAMLRDRAQEDQDTLISDATRFAALERLFQTTIESCMDAAQHVCASEGWGPPKDNADAMRVLQEHNIIDQKLADVMTSAVKFRNVLVHMYADVDPEKVIHHFEHLDDLDLFVAALSSLIERPRAQS